MSEGPHPPRQLFKLGLDAFASTGYGNKEIFGILLIGLGGGAGAQLGRRWYVRKYGHPRN